MRPIESEMLQFLWILQSDLWIHFLGCPFLERSRSRVMSFLLAIVLTHGLNVSVQQTTKAPAHPDDQLVHLISSTWLLLTLLIPVETVRIYFSFLLRSSKEQMLFFIITWKTWNRAYFLFHMTVHSINCYIWKENGVAHGPVKTKEYCKQQSWSRSAF